MGYFEHVFKRAPAQSVVTSADKRKSFYEDVVQIGTKDDTGVGRAESNAIVPLTAISAALRSLSKVQALSEGQRGKFPPLHSPSPAAYPLRRLPENRQDRKEKINENRIFF